VTAGGVWALGHGGGLHVGGNVYVYDLLPARGPALGGSAAGAYIRSLFSST